jgi:hypothetical protein
MVLNAPVMGVFAALFPRKEVAIMAVQAICHHQAPLYFLSEIEQKRWL